MRKAYRISVYNRSKGMRELMWEVYMSRKKAQEMVDKMNALDRDKIIDARVFVQIK